jgi:RNA polymerase sigma factor (TIGR02999 family)
VNSLVSFLPVRPANLPSAKRAGFGFIGPVSDLTRILHSIEQGDPKAAEELLPLVYDELRKLAAARMAHLPPGQTLQPTALVHEAYVRLLGSDQPWDNRGHFFAAAAEAMRRILVESARRKSRLKRGGQWQRIDLEDVNLAIETDPENLLTIDEALTKFAAEDPVKAQLVSLRFFAGLSLPEAAQAMNVSLATSKRYWAFARAWLYREISEDH